MARKKKKRKRKGRLTQKADLPAAAQSYLAKGQFAEAIKCFRRLHKEDGSGRWDNLFVQAFLGRINQLMAKGMGKEALVIYDNMLQIFPEPDPCLHIRLLAAAGMFQQAVEVRVGEDSTLTKSEKTAIDECFASVLLSGQTVLKGALPEKSPVRIHHMAAERALQAYCRGDDSEVHAALREIPYRSPYKHFSLALKGMVAFEKDRNDSLKFFDKIPQNSPFFVLTEPYSCLVRGNHGQVSKLPPACLRFVNTLNGMDVGTANLLNKLKPGMTPSELYQTFVRAGGCLGRKQLRKICYRILPHAPAKISDFQRRFGKLSKLEHARLAALSAEIDGYCFEIDSDWRNVCEILLEQGDLSPDISFKVALIYRHIAELMAKDSFQYSPVDIEEILTRSLEFDPGDKETWLKLVNLKHISGNKRYRLVNTMLETFPDDSEVLTLVIEAAIERGAYKKASRLAGQLLAADPINPRVRKMLIDTHLAHARKMARQHKHAIALRECKLAASYDRNDLSQGRIQIFNGLLSILSGDKKEGLQLLEEAEKKTASLLLAHFEVRMEAGLLHMPTGLLKSFTAQLKRTAKTFTEKDDILQLFEKILLCNEDRHLELNKFRAVLTPCLKKGARLALSRDEFKRVCQVLHLRHYHDLLGVYAKACLRKYGKDPLFLFYKVCAQSKGGEIPLNYRQCATLENAWHKALETGDKGTSDLIDDFLAANSPFTEPMGMGIGPLQLLQEMIKGELVERMERGDITTDEEKEALLEEIIDHIGPEFAGDPEPRKKKQDKDKNHPGQLNLFT